MAADLQSISETVSKHETELEILKLKVQTITDSFNKLEDLIQGMDSKLDEQTSLLVDRLSVQQSEGAVVTERLANQRVELSSLVKKVEKIEEEVVKVKVTIAQKIAYGAIGGSVATAIIKIAEWAMSLQ